MTEEEMRRWLGLDKRDEVQDAVAKALAMLPFPTSPEEHIAAMEALLRVLPPVTAAEREEWPEHRMLRLDNARSHILTAQSILDHLSKDLRCGAKEMRAYREALVQLHFALDQVWEGQKLGADDDVDFRDPKWVQVLGEYQAVEVVSGTFAGQRGYIIEPVFDARPDAKMPLSYFVHLDDSNIRARIEHNELRGLEWKHAEFFEKYPHLKPDAPKEK